MSYSENVMNSDKNIASKGSVAELFSRIFSLKNILCFLIVYLVSKLEFMQGITPFNYAIVGAMQVYNIPLFLTLSAGILGSIAGGFSSAVLIEYIVTIVIFTGISSFIKVEGIDKKMATGLKLALSILLVKSVLMLAGESFITGMYNISIKLIATLIFYSVFVSATFVIANIKKTVIFSKEEIVSAAFLVVLAIAGMGTLNIFGVNIGNVIGMFLVLLVGYKNGWLVGSATGTLIGLLMGIIMKFNPIFVIAYALCGFIAGIIKGTGKIGVILTVILGAILFKNLYIQDAVLALKECEILLALLGLVLLPKKLELRVDSLFNKHMMLESSYGNLLADSEDVSMKLEAIGDLFGNLAGNLDNVRVDNETKEEAKNVVKSYLKAYKEKECLGCKNYKTCLEEKRLDITVDYIIDTLSSNKPVKLQMLGLECEKSRSILNNIKDVYNNIKIAYVLKQKELENNKKVTQQYKEVANVISNIANNIIVGKRKSSDIVMERKINEELKIFGYNIFDSELRISNAGYTEYTFITDILTNLEIQKYEIQSLLSELLGKEMKIKMILNSSKTEKAKIKLVSNVNFDISIATKSEALEGISGDSLKVLDLEDNKKVVIISDGEGKEKLAASASLAVTSKLEKLLQSGFSREKSNEIVENLITLRGENENFATVDLAIIDEINKEIDFIKFGSAPSFIICKDELCVVEPRNLPNNLTEGYKYKPDKCELTKGDVVIMLSDGVYNEKLTEEKRNLFIEMLSELNTNITEEEILEHIDKFTKENFEINDDRSIVVMKIK